jgi:hypothetical protein
MIEFFMVLGYDLLHLLRESLTKTLFDFLIEREKGYGSIH